MQTMNGKCLEPDKASHDEIVENARALSAGYKKRGYHCSESTIRACSEALGLRFSEDVLRCACGFRGGGGGYYDRCGIIEAGCMLISYLYGRLTPEQEVWQYSYLIRQLHERFKSHFSTIYCRDILPKEKERSADPICMRTYQEGAEIIIRLILDAPRLLAEIPAGEKNR